MIRRRGRALLHLGVLGLLVAGVLYGLMMVAGYLMMLAGVAVGRMPVGGLGADELVFGVLMVLLWGGVIVGGFGSLIRQSRRSIALTRWVDRRATTTSPRLARAIATADCRGRVVAVPSGQRYAFTQGIWTPRIVVSTALVERSTTTSWLRCSGTRPATSGTVTRSRSSRCAPGARRSRSCRSSRRCWGGSWSGRSCGPIAPPRG